MANPRYPIGDDNYDPYDEWGNRGREQSSGYTSPSSNPGGNGGYYGNQSPYPITYGSPNSPGTWTNNPNATTGAPNITSSSPSGGQFDFNSIWEQAQKAYGSDAISQYYNLARGNLNRSMGNASSFASRAAGAAGTNMVNPSSFVQSAISGAQSNFAPQYGQLAAQGAQAQQQGQAKLTELLYLINRAKQGDAEAAAQLKARYDEGAESVRQFNANREDSGFSIWDLFTGGASVASNLYGSGMFSGGNTDYQNTINDLNNRGITWLG